jgi:hypothetical protein
MDRYNLSEKDVVFDSVYPNQVYTEKKLSNKVSNFLKRKAGPDYPEIDNHCVSAIVGYLSDIEKQGAKTSVWILPKCSSQNALEGLKKFDETGGGLRHLVYFETDNCFL